MLALFLSVLFVSVFGRDPAASPPSGSYCGTFTNVATMKATVLTPQVAAISGTLYGQAYACPSEACYWDATNNSIIFPNIYAASDCLGSNLASFSIPPSALRVVYIPSDNILNGTITSLAVSAVLSPCKTIEVAASQPSGTYCGNYQGLVSVNASVISLTDFSVSGNVEGLDVSCPTEACSVQSNGDIVLVNIQKPDDCVGALLTSYGIDPTELSLQWNSSNDSITVAIAALSVQFTLTHTC